MIFDMDSTRRLHGAPPNVQPCPVPNEGFPTTIETCFEPELSRAYLQIFSASTSKKASVRICNRAFCLSRAFAKQKSVLWDTSSSCVGDDDDDDDDDDDGDDDDVDEVDDDDEDDDDDGNIFSNTPFNVLRRFKKISAPRDCTVRIELSFNVSRA